MNIKVKYNHPAALKNGVEINVIYSLKRIEDKYYLENREKQIEVDIDKVKILFDVVEGEEEFEALFVENKENILNTLEESETEESIIRPRHRRHQKPKKVGDLDGINT